MTYYSQIHDPNHGFNYGYNFDNNNCQNENNGLSNVYSQGDASQVNFEQNYNRNRIILALKSIFLSL